MAQDQKWLAYYFIDGQQGGLFNESHTAQLPFIIVNLLNGILLRINHSYKSKGASTTKSTLP